MAVLIDSGFQIATRRAAGDDQLVKLKSTANTTYYKGQLGVLNAQGIFTPVSATSKAGYLLMAMENPLDQSYNPAPAGYALGQAFTTTSRCERLLCVPIYGSFVELSCKLIGDAAPIINGVACSANTTGPTTVIVPYVGGAAGDYLNGLIYIPQLGETRLITNTAYAANAYTFTVDQDFGYPDYNPTVNPVNVGNNGETAVVVPWSAGFSGVKFNTVANPSMCLDPSFAGSTGGQNRVTRVDLKKGVVYFECPNLQ